MNEHIVVLAWRHNNKVLHCSDESIKLLNMLQRCGALDDRIEIIIADDDSVTDDLIED